MNQIYKSMLFPSEVTAHFPSTRYQGSKSKLTDWIWDHIRNIDFRTCLDAFGGTGVIAHRLKQEGKQVTYNDLLKFNYHFGKALVENDSMRLDENTISWILQEHSEIEYPTFIQDTFRDIYFTEDENVWLDRTISNINTIADTYIFSLAFFALSQACIVKRPYNLFHRKNLYIRLANVKRSFGNKASWDKSFPEWFKFFANEANEAVFAGMSPCNATNLDALEISEQYDLVYIDTPYISRKGVGLDYADFYHFLEGLCNYEEWNKNVDWKSKHRRMKRTSNLWTDKKRIHKGFEELFTKFSNSTMVVSYRSDGIPSVDELASILKRHKSKIEIDVFGQYKYVLSTNGKSKEVLIVAK